MDITSWLFSSYHCFWLTVVILFSINSVDSLPTSSFDILDETSNARTNLSNVEREDKQLDLIALPLGIATGIFLGSILTPTTTTTTTTTEAPSAGLFVESGEVSSSGISSQLEVSGSQTSSSSQEITSTNVVSGEKDKEFKSLDGCGRKGAGSIRIVGGTQIRKHEYPWLCSLRRRGGHICGITLLSVYPKETILVGAAHCYNKESQNKGYYTVICGEHELNEKESHQVELKVTSVITHPKWVTASQGYDIAVYKVDDSPLRNNRLVEKENRQIYPACLPRVKEGYKDGTFFVAGWGLLKSRIVEGQRLEVRGVQNIPRHVEVPFQECEDPDTIAKPGLVKYPDGLICAGDTGKDSCQGDSGGPLMKLVIEPGKEPYYEWIGIVSYGVGCGAPEYPGAYTRTSCYLEWIAAQFGMSAISSPAAIGHDWSSACPKENKIPEEWIPENADPDTSDASVIQGRLGYSGKYLYSALPLNKTISYATHSRNIIPYTKIPINYNPFFFQFYNHNNNHRRQFFTTNRYIWTPIRRQPIIMYPLLNVPQYT